eukprot:6301546-Lingulodinium_polyedra.AAC.1
MDRGNARPQRSGKTRALVNAPSGPRRARAWARCPSRWPGPSAPLSGLSGKVRNHLRGWAEEKPNTKTR